VAVEHSTPLLAAALASEEHEVVRALRRYWHPVAYSGDVTHRPLAVELLGERLVVVRFADGPRVFADLCAHRGAALSLGWLDDDRLRCAYHGWCYDERGRCVEIPSSPGQRIPDRARLRPYAVRESGGLVWACLEDRPRFDVPPFPEWKDDAFHVIVVPHYDWRCGAHRRTENFVDLSHLPWVHEGVLGDRRYPVTPVHHVRRLDDQLLMEGAVYETPNMKSTPGGRAPAPVHTDNVWRVYPACTIHWRQRFDDGRRFGIFIVASPTGTRQCRTFTLMFRDFDHEGDDARYVEFQLEIAEADRAIAESQRPEELPADLTAELHIKGADAMSIEYRRWLLELAREPAAPATGPSTEIPTATPTSRKRP
jgi:vanillate O-demethylase monooxygenase subunit